MDTSPLAKAGRVLLEIRTTRTSEETPESMKQLFSSLTNLKKRFLLLFKKGIVMSFEVAVVNQSVRFFVTIPGVYQSFIESQIAAQYPKATITKIRDYLPEIFANNATLCLGQLKLMYNYLYPLRTLTGFKDVDPMSSILGALSKSHVGDSVSIQFLLVPVNNSWQARGEALATDKKKDAAGAVQANPYAKVITEKIASHGFKTAIRIAVNSPTKERSWHFLQEIANSFSSFNNPSGNGLVLRRLYFWQPQRMKSVMLSRSRYFMPRQILNVDELATMFHFPYVKLATIHNISWQKTILSDPPEILPVAETMTEDDKAQTNFIGKTIFKNKMTVFGIKENDRRRHVYLIGKTGSGKSTFIANMAINDMRNKKGFCVIDPHGDLCEVLLDYIPSYRINDVVYLDPSNPERTFGLNPLEVQNPLQKELVVSGIVAIFHKLYALSWGPRLEYILRNALLTAIELPNPTLLLIPELLTNDAFRARALEHIHDPVLKSFWVNEFDKMHPRIKTEAMAPILNKVGQFISSHTIRNIIRQPKSTIDLQKIMDEGKILLLNLSQGKLGEDNAALLGAMTITKLQLAAMNRVHQAEKDRKDFFLYVDEFQNFATTSFVKILSEARKYRLNLILANQYIAQIQEEVRSAIFGNAGTMLSFIIGATDSSYMAKEFGERFKEEDLLSLDKYQAIVKLCIEGVTQPPFLCYTLPLPRSITQGREKAIKVSTERYTKPIISDSDEEKKAPVVEVESIPAQEHQAPKNTT